MASLATLSWDEVASTLLAQSWTFAKTMPNNPHFWTLRKTWQGPADFDAVVQHIRTAGYSMKFGKSYYRCFDVNEHRYWTMGAPLPATTLINRAVNRREHPYDAIAERYDAMHSSPEALREDGDLFALIGDAGGSVLDIGCGTGLFLDHRQPSEYLGIDASMKMLEVMSRRHPSAETLLIPFEAFHTRVRFDLIVGLYGVPSYIAPWALERIPGMLNEGGRYFLMFYREDYTPVTHLNAGIEVPFHRHPRDILRGKVHDFGNYFVIEGER